MEAAVRRAFDARRAALRDAELVEDAKLRVEHAAQVERLHRSVCTAALGVRGREEVRNVAATTAPRGERAISTRRVRRAPRPFSPFSPRPLTPPPPTLALAQVSARVHALSQLAKVKIAQGEYAAAWDARNAATQLREAERAEAESAVTADPSCAMDVASLLETHARELRDLRVTQRARHARLDRELADELQRRGLPVDATAEAGVEAEWRRLRRGLPASVDAGARLDAGRPNLLEGPPESGARFASPASAAASFVSASPRPIALDGTARFGSRDARAAPPPPTPSWGAFRTPERHTRAHLLDAAPRAMPQPQMLGAAASFLAASGGPSPGGGGGGGGGEGAGARTFGTTFGE
jgi:hypothetical protein